MNLETFSVLKMKPVEMSVYVGVCFKYSMVRKGGHDRFFPVFAKRGRTAFSSSRQKGGWGLLTGRRERIWR